MPTSSQSFNPILNLGQFAHKQAKKIVPHRWEMNEKSESFVSSTQDENDIGLQSKSGLSLPSEEHIIPLMISGVSEESADFDFLDEVQSSQDEPSFSKPNQSMFPTYSSNVEQLSFSKRQDNSLITKNEYKTLNSSNNSSLHQRFSCYNPNELYPHNQEATTNLKGTESNDIHCQSKSQIDFSSMSIQRDLNMTTNTISANSQVLQTSRNKHWKNTNEPVAEIQELYRSKPMSSLRQNKIIQQNYSQDMYELNSTQVPYRNIQPSTESLKNNNIVLDEKFEMKQSKSVLKPYTVMNQVENGDQCNMRNHVGKHSLNHSRSQTNHIIDSYQMVSPSNQHQCLYSQTDYHNNNYGSLAAKSQSNTNSLSDAFTNSSNYHSYEGHINNPTNSRFQNFKRTRIERVPSVNTCAGIENSVRLFNCKTKNKSENQYEKCSGKINKNESNYGSYSHFKDSVFDCISDEGQDIFFSPSDSHLSRNDSFISNFEYDNLSCSVDNNTLRSYSTCSSSSFCNNQKGLGFNTVPLSNKRTLSKCDGYEYANSTINCELAPLPSVIRNKSALCDSQTSNRVILEKQNCCNIKPKTDYCDSQNPSNAMNKSVELKNNKENCLLRENSLFAKRDPFILERKQQFEHSIATASPTIEEGTNSHTMASLTKNSNYLNSLLQVPETNTSNILKGRDKKGLVNQRSLNKISESKPSEINKQVFLEEKKPNSCVTDFNKSMIESKTGILMRQESVGYEVHFPSEDTKPETIDLSNYHTDNEDFTLDDTGMCCLTETDEELLLADEVDIKNSVTDSHLTASGVNENSAQNTNNKNEISTFVPILSDELIFYGQLKKSISVKPLFLDFEQLNSKATNVNTQNCFENG